jgi:hypothetical protein
MAPCLGGERQVEELLGEPDEVAWRVGLFTGLAVAQEQGGAVDGIPNVDVGFTDQYFRPEVLRDPARFAVEVGVPVPAGDDADVADGRPLACQRWFLRGFTKLSSLFSFLALFRPAFPEWFCRLFWPRRFCGIFRTSDSRLSLLALPSTIPTFIC